MLDPYIPQPDAVERHEITINARPDLVFEVARDFDMESIALVRTIIRLRAWMLGARGSQARRSGGLVADTLAMGWGRLEDLPGRYYIAGAACLHLARVLGRGGREQGDYRTRRGRAKRSDHREDGGEPRDREQEREAVRRRC